MNELEYITKRTCALDSVHHLESARERKQRKTEYQQILSEFDRLGIPCSNYTIELAKCFRPLFTIVISELC